MKYRVLVSVIFVFVFLVLFTVLERNELLPLSPNRSNTVLVVLKDLNNPFFKEMKNGIDQQAHDLRRTLKLVVKAGNGDTDSGSQVQIIEQQLQQSGLQALIITPVESPDLVATLRKLNEKGIPIVIVDSALANQAPYGAIPSNSQQIQPNSLVRYTAFIASDNSTGGRKAAEYMRKLLPDEQRLVWIVKGPESAETSQSRVSGFKDNAYKSWSIMESLVEDWKQITAHERTRKHLESSNLIPDAVFACNDEMALGVLSALDSQLKNTPTAKRPLVVGFDGTQEALESIMAHKLSATVAQKPFEMGIEAVNITNTSISKISPVRSINMMPVELVRR